MYKTGAAALMDVGMIATKQRVLTPSVMVYTLPPNDTDNIHNPTQQR